MPHAIGRQFEILGYLLADVRVQQAKDIIVMARYPLAPAPQDAAPFKPLA